MSKIAKDQIEHIAHLARLALSDKEKERFSAQLSAILDHVDELNKVDTLGVEPIGQITGLQNVLRNDADDVASETLDREEALKNAGDQEGGYFKMRNIFRNTTTTDQWH